MGTNPKFRQQLRLISAGCFLSGSIVGAAGGMQPLFALMGMLAAGCMLAAWNGHRPSASR